MVKFAWTFKFAIKSQKHFRMKEKNNKTKTERKNQKFKKRKDKAETSLKKYQKKDIYVLYLFKRIIFQDPIQIHR